MSVLLLVVPDPEGLEGLDVVDLVQDRTEVFNHVRAKRFDILLSKSKFSYKLGLRHLN